MQSSTFANGAKTCGGLNLVTNNELEAALQVRTNSLVLAEGNLSRLRAESEEALQDKANGLALV